MEGREIETVSRGPARRSAACKARSPLRIFSIRFHSDAKNIREDRSVQVGRVGIVQWQKTCTTAMSTTPATATRMIQVVESLLQLSNRVPMRSHQRKLRNFAMAIYKQQKHEDKPEKLDALCDLSQKRIDEVYQRWGERRLGPKPTVHASEKSTTEGT